MTLRGKLGQALLGLALLTAGLATANAGSFTVNPVRLTLSATQSIAAVTVKNVGSETTVVQLETFSWAQHGGHDELTSSNEILATPPIITVAPGASRIIRVGLRRPLDPQHELTYRLFLREVPPPEPIAQGLRVALLINMPVFVVPARLTGPRLDWHAIRTRDGNIRLQARNSGQSHVQMGQLDIAAGDTTVATRSLAEYVLSDSEREWTVTAKSAPPPGTPLHIFSQTDAGPLKADVTLEDDPRELNPNTPQTAAR